MAIAPLIHTVDDDESIRDFVSVLLTSAGYKVRTYPDAETFIANFVDDAPGCLILDMSMPGMSGLDLLSEIERREIDIPVIMLSGSATLAEAVRAMRLGAVHFIEKPIDPTALMNEVKASVDRHVEIWASRGDRQAGRVALDSLTGREREIAQQVVAGKSSKEIGRTLGISPRTVEVHRRRILAKFGVRSAIELAGKIQGIEKA